MLLIHADHTGGFVDVADLGKVAAGIQGKTRLFVFHHGWMTSEEDLAAHVAAVPAALTDPATTLAIAVKWPSLMTPCLALDIPSFWPCAQLANTVGANMGRDILETAMEHAAGPLEIVVLGHSFGCRVACESVASVRDGWARASAKLILLQAAFPANAMEQGGPYSRLFICDVLATTSKEDRALGFWYGIAEPFTQALGYGGPTQATQSRFLSHFKTIDILPWQKAANPVSADRHFEVWNLPPLWQAIENFVDER